MDSQHEYVHLWKLETLIKMSATNGFLNDTNNTYGNTSGQYNDRAGLLSQVLQFEVTCFLAFGILVIILGIIGNTLSFIVINRDYNKGSTFYFLQYLAVLDNLLLITMFLQYSVLVGHHFEFMDQRYMAVRFCILTPLALSARLPSAWLTVAVTIDRYIAVCRPLQAKEWCTIPRARKSIITILLLSIAISLPRFFECIGYEYCFLQPECPTIQTVLLSDKHYQSIYHGTLFCFRAVIPLLILVVLNCKLVRAVRERNRRRTGNNVRVGRQSDNVTRVVIIVITVFAICVFPSIFVRAIWLTREEWSPGMNAFYHYFNVLSGNLIIINSAVNFIIYDVASSVFRMQCRHLVCRKCDVDMNLIMATSTAETELMNG